MDRYNTLNASPAAARRFLVAAARRHSIVRRNGGYVVARSVVCPSNYYNAVDVLGGKFEFSVFSFPAGSDPLADVEMW